MEENGVAIADSVAARAQSEEEQGRTVVHIAIDGVHCGIMALGDAVRESAGAAVSTLKALGIKTVLLSGDNLRAVTAVANTLGIDEVRAEVLPDEKAEEVRRFQAEGHVVAMVGDGVNDAPALATADVGVAMGSGTQVAMNTAQITLVRPDLILIADAIALSKETMRKIRQNLFFAFIFNAIGIPLAAFGLLSPMLAGGAMACSSVTVVVNALRLRKFSPHHEDAQ